VFNVSVLVSSVVYGLATQKTIQKTKVVLIMTTQTAATATTYKEQEITVFENGQEFDVIVPASAVVDMVVTSPFTGKEVMTVDYDGNTVNMVLREGYGFTEDGEVTTV